MTKMELFKTVIKIPAVKPLKMCNFVRMDREYKILTDKKLKDYLSKWGMNLKIFTYSFENNFKSVNFNKIISDLFQSEITAGDLDFPIPTVSNEQTEFRIEVEAVPCTILSLDFFDRIYSTGIALFGGTIRKCFEEYIDEIVIADELRNMLIAEESENYSIYNEKEREEFLFRIFCHLCLGGALNQYEDNIEPYITMSKAMYKDLVSVRKSRKPPGESKEIFIASKVFKVSGYVGCMPAFPSTNCHEQNFAYIIIDPLKYEVTIVKHVWKI